MEMCVHSFSARPGLILEQATSTPQLAPLDVSGRPVKLHRVPKITHETVRIDWTHQSAHEVDALFRGMSHQVSSHRGSSLDFLLTCIVARPMDDL